MGMSPAEVDASSLWQLQAVSEGYRRAHMSDEERAKEITPDEFKALEGWV